jgi:ANTAR domain-containing protein
MTAERSSGAACAPDVAALPADVLRTPTGEPAVVLVRTPRGWSVLSAADPGAESRPNVLEPLPLVEAMSLGDLVAEESGATPEPGRPARRAARGGADDPSAEAGDPRDAELASLRRTVGQLEHALAARVSIERAIGVLAERHATGPQEAFEELRRSARAQGRPAQELAREVLDALLARVSVPDQRMAGEAQPEPGPAAASPSPDQAPGTRPPTARRVTRGRPRQAVTPGTEAEGVS